MTTSRTDAASGSVWFTRWRALVDALGGAAVVLLLLTVVADVTLRFILNHPLPGATEYVSFWYMVAIAFLGLSMAERHGEHIDAPIVFERLSVGVRREFTVISKVLFAATMAVMAWYGWEEAVRQFEIGERAGAAAVPIWPARFLVPLGTAACAADVMASLLSRRPGEPVPSAGPDRLGGPLQESAADQ